MHPLSPDMSDLSDEQLLTKVNDLYTRRRQAMGMNNPAILAQLGMLLDDYQAEYNRRQAELAEKFAAKNKNLTEKIKI